MQYPEALKYFPRNEEWASGDEHLDLKLNQLLLESFKQLSSHSISLFYDQAIQFKPRVNNPMFILNIEMVLKAMLSLLNPLNELDQDFIKIKGHFNLYQVDDEIIEINLNELNVKSHVRILDQLDFFKRDQTKQEANPFVTHKIMRAPFYYEVKPIYKELLDAIENQVIPKKYDHQLFNKLAQKRIVNVNGNIRIWVDQRRFFCVQ